MVKYKFYIVSPFDQYHHYTRKEAERFYVEAGRTSAILYGVKPNNEWVELKSKY